MFDLNPGFEYSLMIIIILDGPLRCSANDLVFFETPRIFHPESRKVYIIYHAS